MPARTSSGGAIGDPPDRLGARSGQRLGPCGGAHGRGGGSGLSRRRRHAAWASGRRSSRRSSRPVDEPLGDAEDGLPVDELRVHVRRRGDGQTRRREDVLVAARAEHVDRLGDPRAGDLRREHVLLAQRREQRLDVLDVGAPDVGRRALELGAVRVDVLRRVDERAADALGVDDVRRLDDGRQRDPAVGDVHRVVRADALAHAHHQADDAEVAQRVGPDGELQLGREQRLGVHRQHRRDDLVGGLEPGRGDDADGAAARGDDARDLRRRADRAAAGADRRGERVDEHLVPAVDRPHDLARRAVARAGHPA